MRSLPTKTVREAAGTGSSCPIDQSDVARNLQEGARRSIIPEAAAKNDDAWSIDGCHRGRCGADRELSMGIPLAIATSV